MDTDPSRTMLQSYNCNQYQIPKPEWSYRARKQIFKPSYVLSHFIHYSPVTADMVIPWSEANRKGISWNEHSREDRNYNKNIDEATEAVLLHAKAVIPNEFPEQLRFCQKEWKNCRLGYAWPNNKKVESTNESDLSNKDGFVYTCFINKKVEKFWVPRLEQNLAKHMERRKLTS